MAREPRNLLRESAPAQAAPTQPRNLLRQQTQEPDASPTERDRRTGMAVAASQLFARQQPIATRALQSLNLSDEAMGGVASMFGADGQRVAQVERDRVTRDRQERPIMTFAQEMASTLPLGVAGAAVRPLQAAARAAPMMTAAATGAVGAGVAGAGAGETPVDRVQGGAIGAGIGAILGPATVAAAGLGGRGVARIRNMIAGRAADEAADASPAAVRFAQRSGVMRDMADNPQALAGRDGDFVAERLGPGARQTALGMAGMGDQAQGVAEDAITSRASGRAERVAGAAQRATQMDGRRPVDALMGIDEVRAQAKPLFDEADEQLIRMTPQLRENLRRLQRAGVTFRRADELAGITGDARVTLSQYADDIDALPDRIRLGDVRALAMAAEDEAGAAFSGGRGQSGAAISNAAREVRDNLRRQNRTYAEAAQLWSSAARDDQAFSLGEQIFRPGSRAERDLRQFATSGTSQSERRQFLAGVADAIDRRMSTGSVEGNAAASLNRRGVQDRLRRILGEDAAEELIDRIGVETRQARFEATANREVNSATAARLEGRQRVERAASGSLRGFAAELVENPLEAIRGREARRQVASLIRQGDDEALAQVARVLYSTEDVRQDPLVRAILGEARRRNIAYQSGQPVATAITAQNTLQNRD